MNMTHDAQIYWWHKKKDAYWVEKIIKKKKNTIEMGRKSGLVGFATSPAFAEDIPLFLSDEVLKKTHTLFARVQLMGINKKDHIFIFLGADFYDDLKADESLESAIAHEVGHILGGHLEMGSEKNKILEARWDLQQNGVVAKTEIEADRFAVQYCGRDAMIHFLNYALENAEKYRDPHNISAEAFEAMIWEVQQRIKLLSETNAE